MYFYAAQSIEREGGYQQITHLRPAMKTALQHLLVHDSQIGRLNQ